MTSHGGLARDRSRDALEEPRAQVETVSQHQQGNEQAGRAEKHELLENLAVVDGDNDARKRPCDSSHL